MFLKADKLKSSLQAQILEHLTIGCHLELGLEKYKTLSGLQLLSTGRTAHPEAAELPELRRGRPCIAQGLQILSGPEPH